MVLFIYILMNLITIIFFIRKKKQLHILEIMKIYRILLFRGGEYK